MKKQHIYSVLVLTAVLTAGCAKENENLKLNDGNSSAIELSSVSTDPMTRAVITGTSFTTAEAAAGIGLFLLDKDGETYGTNPANVKYTFSSDKWTAASPLRIGGDKGYLYGYYPYGSSVMDITAIPVASSINGTDWLYATPVEVTTSNAKSVSMALSHALARVSLSFKLDGSYVGDGSLSEISLSGGSIAASGTLDATDGTLDATASKFTASTEQTLSKSAATAIECLVVPVAVYGSSTPDVKIGCVIDDKYFEATFSGDKAVEILQGVQTSISFTVKNTSVSVDGSSIGAWGEGGTQTVTVGGDYTVTIALAEGVTAHDVLTEVYVDGDDVIVCASSYSGQHLKCTMPDGEFCTSQSKTSNLAYTFTISNITENTTATIGYASPVSLSVSPESSGSVEITGDAYEGETVTLTAIPAYEYGFDAWLDKDGEPLSCEDETYSNPVRLSSDGISVKFKYSSLILNGEFTVNATGKKVRFTRGNLYYDGSSKIEQHQYDFNSMQWTIERTHVSHFMWFNNISDATAQTYETFWDGQSPFFTEVDGFTVKGFSENQCRTLTSAEWQYLFSYGTTYDNDIRRGKYKLGVTICSNTNCVVLLPDNWTGGTIEDSYDYVGWKHMEVAGAVCLPAAGLRDGINGITNIIYAGDRGYYWSASPNDDSFAFDLRFDSSNVDPYGNNGRLRANSVRLVTDVTE